MTGPTSQQFETYVPVYDYVPEKWEEARQFLVEHLKKISNAVNIREIGWHLDQEVISGQQFIPSPSNNQDFRTILRQVYDFGAGPFGPGVHSIPHNVTVDANFSLIDLWGAATKATAAFSGTPINQPNINYDTTNINITLTATYDRLFAFFLYIQEL
jgi:hypothetical protein